MTCAEFTMQQINGYPLEAVFRCWLGLERGQKPGRPGMDVFRANNTAQAAPEFRWRRFEQSLPEASRDARGTFGVDQN